MNTRQFKLTLISSVVLLFAMYGTARYGEYQIERQVVKQCNERKWDELYDRENRSFCLRFFTERGLAYKYW